MRRLLVLLIFLAATPLLAMEPVGKVIDLAGEAWVTHAWVTHAQEKAVVAFLNQEIQLGDVIKTKANGAVKILFIDDTILTVKENSSVLITEFLFDSKAKQRKVVFNAQYGKIRTLIGKFVGRDQLVEIRTPTAVAGIRGTDIAALVQPRSTTFYCFICDPNLVSIFNAKYTDKVVSLATEQAIEVIMEVPASEKNIVPVPEGTQPRFDIPKEGATGKAVQAAGKEAAKEAVGKEAPVAKEPSAESLLEKVTTETGSAAVDPGTAAGGTPPNPGAALENKTGSTVKITLP